MSPWPGAPKSASSPPINQPSVRFPFTLDENASMADVVDAMRTAYNGLTVHEQAFANLPEQISTQAATAATAAVEQVESVTTSGVTSFNTQTGGVIFFPGLGTVNDQLGQSSYTVQQSDAGAKIIVGDSSAVTVTLGASISAPWFTIIDNDSSAVVNLSGPIQGDSSISANGFAIAYFDGTFYWVGVANPPSGLTTTITTAKLTTGGTEGSMGFTSGILTTSTPAT